MPVQTTTWSKGSKLYVKMTKKTEPSPRRPETAILEKPLVLDPKLLRKLDMTTLSKEKLMSIQNLILTPKVRSKNSLGQSSLEDEDSCAVDEPKVKRFSKGLNTTYRIRSNVRKGLSELFPPSIPSSLSSNRLKLPEKVKKELSNKTNDKNKNISKPTKPVSQKEILEEVSRDVIPPPCCTCGRSEQPERLHSHPDKWDGRKAKAPRSSSEQENRIVPQPKSSVRKPNPIKYRSGRVPAVNQEQKPNPIVRKETFKIDVKKSEDIQVPPKRKISHIPVIRRSPNPSAAPSPTKSASHVQTTPVKRSPISSAIKDERSHSAGSASSSSSSSLSPRRPRTVVCYICMRDFGTASLPLHEPHCLQRWERENASLPPNLRRRPPKKPDRPLTSDEWNEFAYATAQASLVPCDKCGRKFQPDRLPIHTKACLGSKKHSASSEEPKEYVNIVGKEPCYLCGWMIPSELLANHEEACLAKWQSDNDKLPPELQKPLPLKPGQEKTSITSQHAPPRRRMAICYICGREFGSASIRIHEPQCMKKWKVENEKLPPEQRRSEPKKPKVIYTTDGQVDIEATDEAFWQSHLVQLVPCGKCGRTFNPDRVGVHEKACKGPQPQKH
ncbi:uncharacterized protein LOC142321552 isoform X2 [Lycorma delicatula]